MYGVRSGSNNAPGSIVGEKNSFTQEDISQKLGMDVRTLQNYKILSEMIPELSDLVDTGVVACFLKKNPPVYNFRRDFLSKTCK